MKKMTNKPAIITSLADDQKNIESDYKCLNRDNECCCATNCTSKNKNKHNAS